MIQDCYYVRFRMCLWSTLWQVNWGVLNALIFKASKTTIQKRFWYTTLVEAVHHVLKSIQFSGWYFMDPMTWDQFGHLWHYSIGRLSLDNQKIWLVREELIVGRMLSMTVQLIDLYLQMCGQGLHVYNSSITCLLNHNAKESSNNFYCPSLFTLMNLFI